MLPQLAKPSQDRLLSPAQEQIAINYHARRFDERSKRIIQHTVGVHGIIGPNAFAQGSAGLVHTIAHELEN